MGASSSIFEKDSVLNNYNLRENHFMAEIQIIGSGTPTLKQPAAPDMPGVVLLRTEGQTATVDAIDTVPYAPPVDNSGGNSVFGVLVRGGRNGLGRVKKVLYIKAYDRSGSATSLSILRYGSFGLTNLGNIAFTINATGLNLTSENADIVIEIDYVRGSDDGALDSLDDLPLPPLGPSAVDLGTAANYRILTQSGISSAGTEVITGNLGVSPAAATSITGFGLVLDGSGTFSTSAEVTGQVFAADYAAPTPAQLTQAVLDKNTAYTDAMSRSPDVVELNGGNLGGLNLAPGVYFFSTNITIPTNLTLTGSATDKWIFQSTGNLSLAAATQVVLAGGAVASNVVWAVVSAAGLGATSTMRGTILSSTNITFGTGSTLRGRLYAGTAVTLDSTTVSS